VSAASHADRFVEELAQHNGYSPNSSGFNNSLSKLRTSGTRTEAVSALRGNTDFAAFGSISKA
jgi:hypothetical protein